MSKKYVGYGIVRHKCLILEPKLSYNMNQNLTLTVLLLLCGQITLTAQRYKSPFKAGVTIGINQSQIDGDEQFGYKRRGLNLGLRGAVILNKKMDISTELLYSERGTLPSDAEKSKNKRTVYVSLRYAEVPFLFNYFYEKGDDGHFKWNIYTGISYGRLLRSQTNVYKTFNIQDSVQQDLLNKVGYNTSDFSLIVGVKRCFTNRLGLSLRHTSSLNLLYDNPPPLTPKGNPVPTKNFTSFRSFHLSLNVTYDFFTPKLQKPRKKK